MKVTQIFALSGRSIIFGLGIEIHSSLRQDTEVFEPNCEVFLLLYKELPNSSDHLGRLFHDLSNQRLQLFALREFDFDASFLRFGN